jgi:undecaprenyl-diphosphatase
MFIIFGYTFIYFFPVWWNLIVRKPLSFSALYDSSLWTIAIPQVVWFGFLTDGITFLIWYANLTKYIQVPLGFGFACTALALYSLSYNCNLQSVAYWKWYHGVMLGIVQGFALFPGVSRFASTLAILQWIGYRPFDAYAVSFLVQFPLLAAGSLYGLYKLSDHGMMQVIWSYQFAFIGICIAFVSYKVLQFVGLVIKQNKLWKLAYYMVIPIVLTCLV